MDKVFAIVGAVVLGLVGLLALSFLLSWPVYMLWNGCLVGAIAGVSEVSWLQAWGLTALCGFLFKAQILKSKQSIKGNMNMINRIKEYFYKFQLYGEPIGWAVITCIGFFLLLKNN